MGTLTREQILAAHDIATVRVAVPEWGGEVIIRTLSGLERAAHEDQASKIVDGGDGQAGVRRMALLVVATVVDESGTRVFSPEDVDTLITKDFRPLYACFMAARALNVLSKDDVDGLAKN